MQNDQDATTEQVTAAPETLAEAAPAAAEEKPVPTPVRPRARSTTRSDYLIGLGRRKTSVARVFIKRGEGRWEVNGRTLEDYFPRPTLRQSIIQGFEVTGTAGQYDVKVNVRGGGLRGQADAVRLGVARALLEVDPEHRSVLRANELLTRDPREVERKKPGRPKARKRFQFSKR